MSNAIELPVEIWRTILLDYGLEKKEWGKIAQTNKRFKSLLKDPFIGKKIRESIPNLLIFTNRWKDDDWWESLKSCYLSKFKVYLDTSCSMSANFEQTTEITKQFISAHLPYLKEIYFYTFAGSILKFSRINTEEDLSNIFSNVNRIGATSISFLKKQLQAESDPKTVCILSDLSITKNETTWFVNVVLEKNKSICDSVKCHFIQTPCKIDPDNQYFISQIDKLKKENNFSFISLKENKTEPLTLPQGGHLSRGY